jgi:acyl-CoA synthetase (NDP forming)
VLVALEVDALVIIYTPVNTEDAAKILAAIGEGVATAHVSRGAAEKPVVACIMADTERAAALPESIPTYAFPENAVRALGKVWAYAKWRTQPAGLYWGFDDIHPEAARAICHAARGHDRDGRRAAHSAAASDAVTAIPDPTTNRVSDGSGESQSVWLNAQDTCALLHAYGIPAAASLLAHTADEAAALAAVVGFRWQPRSLPHGCRTKPTLAVCG